MLSNGEHGRERGLVGARREPFVSVDNPLVAVEYCGGLHLGGIGSGDLWFGEPDRRVHLARNQRFQETLSLLVAGVEMQHDRVLHRQAADCPLAPVRATDHLVEVDEVHERQTAATDFFWMAECPQPCVFALLFQGRSGRLAGLVVTHQCWLFGNDDVVDERTHPSLEVPQFW